MEFWQQRITFAVSDDIPRWMDLVYLVIGGYPCLQEEDYVNRLREYISHKRAMILKDGETAIGIMLFREETGSIDFLGVHPICGAPLVSVFSGRGTPVYQIARKGFLIFSSGFLFCGVNIFSSAFFTALSDGKRSAVISSLRTFVLIVFFLFTLPQYFGAIGVWLAVPLAEGMTLLVSGVFLMRNGGRYHYL